MKNTHVSTIILSFFSFLMVVSGCRKGSETFDLFGDNTKKEKLERVTLTFYFMGTENPYMREVLDEIEKRTRNTLNAKLDFKFIDYYQYTDGLTRVLAQRSPCDMFMTASYLDVIDSVTESKAALDISGLFPRYAPNYFNKLDEGDLAFFKRDGGLFGVPSYISYTERPCAIVRDDLMKKYGIPSIHGLDDLERYMELAKNEEEMSVLGIDRGMPLVNIFAGYYGYTVLDSGLGLVYKRGDPEMKVLAWEQIPEFKDIIDRVYGWYRKGYFLPDYFYLDLQLIADIPRWCAWIANQLTVFNLNSVIQSKNEKFRYEEYPLFPDTPAQRSLQLSDGLVVSASSEHPERALMFIEWIHANQKNYDLMRLGIEGRNYTLKGEQFLLPNGVDFNRSFLRWQNYTLVDFEYERSDVANSPSYVSKLRTQYRSISKVPQHMGFRLDTSGLKTTPRITTMDSIERDMENGFFNSATVEKFISDQKKWGVGSIVAEAQSQLDEWRKGKNGGK